MMFFPLLVLAAAANLTNEAPAAFETVVGGGAFGQAGMAEGNAFALMPLNGLVGWGPSVTDSLLFFEPLIGLQEGGTYNASLGLGFRKLFADPTEGRSKLARGIDLLGEGWYLGGNLFVDGMHSAHDLDHSQLSTGIEIGSRYLTLHANYYQPLTGAKRWGQSTDLQITSSRGKNYDLYAGPLVTSGPATGTRDVHVTTTPYESFREKLVTYGLYDEALRGWDTELSMLVPSIDKYVDFRLVAGLYGFDGGSTGRGFQGWQMGAEFRPVPAVVLMATRFNDDRYRAGQWIAGVRFEIPLGTRFNDGFRLRERSLSERLMEPVQRQSSPSVASNARPERVTMRTKEVTKGPATIEQLQLSGNVPGPGDIIALQDGTLLVVAANGRTLHPLNQHLLKKGSAPPTMDVTGIIWYIDSTGYANHTGTVVPEPARALLLLLGLTGLSLRRRRTTT